jgi:hypothetical protein
VNANYPMMLLGRRILVQLRPNIKQQLFPSGR